MKIGLPVSKLHNTNINIIKGSKNDNPRVASKRSKILNFKLIFRVIFLKGFLSREWWRPVQKFF